MGLSSLEQDSRDCSSGPHAAKVVPQPCYRTSLWRLMLPERLDTCMLQGFCSRILELRVSVNDADFQTWRLATACFMQPLSVGGGGLHGTASNSHCCNDQSPDATLQRTTSAAYCQTCNASSTLHRRCAKPCYNRMVQGSERAAIRHRQ